MNRNFDKIEQKFAVMEQRFGAYDGKLILIDDKITHKIEALKEKINHKFGTFESKYDAKLIATEERTDRRFASLQNRIWINFIWIMDGFIGVAGLIARSQHGYNPIHQQKNERH
jgi:hypothetical protein